MLLASNDACSITIDHYWTPLVSVARVYLSIHAGKITVIVRGCVHYVLSKNQPNNNWNGFTHVLWQGINLPMPCPIITNTA